MRVKTVTLNSTFKKTKIMTSGPTTSRQIEGKKWKVSDFIFLVSKINVYGGCSHEIKRILGRIAMMNQESVFKSRDITLLTNTHVVKAMVFPVVMYRCELACLLSHSVVSDSLRPYGL